MVRSIAPSRGRCYGCGVASDRRGCRDSLDLKTEAQTQGDENLLTARCLVDPGRIRTDDLLDAN